MTKLQKNNPIAGERLPSPSVLLEIVTFSYNGEYIFKSLAFKVEGGRRLSGEIEPQVAKNEALQVICATLLTDQKVTIENIPDIVDVRKLISLLRGLNVDVQVIGVRG